MTPRSPFAGELPPGGLYSYLGRSQHLMAEPQPGGAVRLTVADSAVSSLCVVVVTAEVLELVLAVARGGKS